MLEKMFKQQAGGSHCHVCMLSPSMNGLCGTPCSPDLVGQDRDEVRHEGKRLFTWSNNKLWVLNTDRSSQNPLITTTPLLKKHMVGSDGLSEGIQKLSD